SPQDICGNTCSRSGRRVRVPSRIRVERPKRRVMRTYDLVVSIGLVGLVLGLAPAASFDGTPNEEINKLPAPQSRDRGRAPSPAPAGPSLQAIPPAAGVPRPPASIPQGAIKRTA